MPYGRQDPYTPPYPGSIRKEEFMQFVCNFMKDPPETKIDSHQMKSVLRLSKDLDLPRHYKQKVVDYIAYRMFRSNFKDSRCASLLLNPDCCSLRSLMIPGANPAVRRDLHHEFVAYFLEHAYRRKMLFGSCRVPCVKVFDGFSELNPVHYAVYDQNLPLLGVLLRYGALLSSRRWMSQVDGGWWFVTLLRTWVLPTIKDLNPRLLLLEDLGLKPGDNRRYQSLLKSCSLFLPDLPRLSPKLLKNVFFRGRYYLKEDEEVVDYIRGLSARVVPGLDQRFSAPLNLKSACRNVIRWRLNEKWLLPRGINRLPLPKVLKQFIDLEIL